MQRRRCRHCLRSADHAALARRARLRTRLGAPPIGRPQDTAREHLRRREARDHCPIEPGGRAVVRGAHGAVRRRSRLRTTTCRRCAPAGSRRSCHPQLLYQFDDETLAELPDVARDVVHISRGDRSSKFRKALGIQCRASITRAPRASSRPFSSAPTSAKPSTCMSARSGRALPIRRQPRPTSRGPTSGAPADGPRRSMDSIRGGSSRAGSATARRPPRSRSSRCGQSRASRSLARALTSKPELAELATDLRRRGLNGSLANGALGFALLGVDAPREKQSWSMADPVESAGHRVVADDDSGSPVHRRRRSSTRSRCRSSRFATRVRCSERRSRRTATAAPPARSRHAGRCGARPRECDAVPVSVIQTVRVLPHPCAATGVCPTPRRAPRPACSKREECLRAVPVTGGSLRRPRRTRASRTSRHSACSPSGSARPRSCCADPDLRLIARSAERWRRTCAGDWAYGSVTAVRHLARRPDASIADRIAQLDSREACLAEMRICGAPARPTPRTSFGSCARATPPRIRRSRGAPPDEAALTLLDHDVPPRSSPPWRCSPQSKGRAA